MELKRTMMRTRNVFRGFKTWTLAEGPTPCSHKEPPTFAQRTDDDLVQAAQLGDHEAFSEL